MKSDIEIAHECKLENIEEVAKIYGIPTEELEHYGKYIAKVPVCLSDKSKMSKSKLILVTSITPTKAGIGKTTTCVGLVQGLSKIGKKALAALREPSLGPCFGMKGGATGGGYSQLLPMEKINLHFTGDFHAISAANNLISALLDNYQYQHQAEGFALKEVYWRRTMDINDRNLRSIVTGLGGRTNGLTSESGFDITPASEIMAILCLAENEEDLEERINNILLGMTADNKPFTVRDMGVAGAIVTLLHEAINPNFVQTTENTGSFVHGGPFANIAHGCNSVVATKLAMSYSDYVVTEAGFGADLGAEKFYDIKCRKAGLQPDLTVLVSTTQGLKMHGGVALENVKQPNAEGVRRGLENLDKHLKNLQGFGQTVVVTLNKFATDTEEEINIVREHCKELNVGFAINDAFVNGGDGCKDFAQLVVDTIEAKPSAPLKFTYSDTDSVTEKIEKVALNIYGAKEVVYEPAAKKLIDRLSQWGYGNLPVCIAKTQYSFSDNAKNYGVPKDFVFTIRDIEINAGAGIIVAIAGDIMRMPGLSKHPNAEVIKVVNGEITGLS